MLSHFSRIFNLHRCDSPLLEGVSQGKCCVIKFRCSGALEGFRLSISKTVLGVFTVFGGVFEMDWPESSLADTANESFLNVVYAFLSSPN
eukprot:UN16837